MSDETAPSLPNAPARGSRIRAAHHHVDPKSFARVPATRHAMWSLPGMSLKRRLSLRCLLWAVSLSGCATAVPQGDLEPPTHVEHAAALDDRPTDSGLDRIRGDLPASARV